jgi:fructose/tagatose bisphosphate aldolase
MTLVPLPELLAQARRDGYAVGYFEAWDSYSLDAVVQAVEAERAPVILGFGCLLVDRGWLERGGIEAFAGLGRAAAERADVPVALLLNEARTVEQALRGLDAGFNATMVHGAAPAEVARLVREAHTRGVAVEGELGELPAGGDDSQARLTDPGEAAAYVAETGVDCLAVSFGNVHVLEGRAASVDLDRLEAISRSVDLPLAVHGGTSFPPELVPGAIARGAAKFNVGTRLKRAFLEGLTEALLGATAPAGADLHELLGSRGSADLLAAGAERMRDVVRELIRLYGGSGRAG